MSAPAPPTPAPTEDFVGTTNRGILDKRVREVGALLAFLPSVQALPLPTGIIDDELGRLLKPLKLSFKQVRATRTPTADSSDEEDADSSDEEDADNAGDTTPAADPSLWLSQADTSFARFMRHRQILAFALALTESQEEDVQNADPAFTHFVLLLFNVPLLVDGASVYTRIRDPGDVRHTFQGNDAFMALVARCTKCL